MLQLTPAWLTLIAGFVFLWHSGLWYVVIGQEGGPMATQERVRAPELEGGIEWLNIDTPLSLAGLRGKIVLLDFWTYCCINCLHVIPELQRLEADFPNELVVIGVHSAKFPNEGESENIRQAILRYDIEHPVVNDREFQIWRRYGPQAWPTLVLIDPEGYVVGGISGEGHYETLKGVIGRLVDEHRSRGTLNEQPLSLVLEKAAFHAPVLSFPGKVAADPERDRLFIADSSHNRILLTTRTGRVLDVAGTGAAGAVDGGFEAASFGPSPRDGCGRRQPVCGRHGKSPHPPTRPQGPHGDNGGRHRPALVQRLSPGQGSGRAAQLAVGCAGRKRYRVYRHGRPAPDLGSECPPPGNRTLRRLQQGSPD